MLSNALFAALFLLPFIDVKANVGQPGIWDAGGGMRPLILEESSISKSITMSSERVDIFLYSGFAIIHGEYTMINMHDASLRFMMGFPINELHREGFSEEPFGYSFRMDSLASFKVIRDGIVLPELSYPTKDQGNWITWDISFAPKQKSTIEVTYMIPTDHAYITNLQGRRDENGLVYIFESGASWHGPIERAELYVHFSDGLSSADILGIRPCDEIEIDADYDIIRWTKSDWEPAPSDNFYLLYERRKNKHYSFNEGIEDQSKLYQQISQTRNSISDKNKWATFECNDILKTETTNAYVKIVASFLAGSITIFILLVFAFRKIIKSIRS